MTCSFFFPLCELFFPLYPLFTQKLDILVKPNLSTVFLAACVLCFTPKIYCLINPRSQRFTPIFSSMSLTVLVDIMCVCVCVCILGLKFYIWYEISVQIQVSTCGYPVVLMPFVENTIHSSLNGFSNLIKNHLSIDIWNLFWTLKSVPLIFLSIYMQGSLSLDCCTFVT